MLEVILDKHILGILMGASLALGVICKLAAGFSLKRLLRASGNMGKSDHPLIRLVKAKFEHACMVSDRVQNVDVFVEKYLYEYRTAGLKLHSWRRLERAGVWLCLVFGLAGAAAVYAQDGMGDPVLRYAGAGAGGAILLFLFQLTSDEKYQLEVIKNYMVDHLENVCARRYEKNQAGKAREEWRAMALPEEETQPVREPVRQAAPGRQEEVYAQPAEKPRQVVPMSRPVQPAPEEPKAADAVHAEASETGARAVREQPAKETGGSRSRSRAEEKDVSREVRIREILEEFLA